MADSLVVDGQDDGQVIYWFERPEVDFQFASLTLIAEAMLRPQVAAVTVLVWGVHG